MMRKLLFLLLTLALAGQSFGSVTLNQQTLNQTSIGSFSSVSSSGAITGGPQSDTTTTGIHTLNSVTTITAPASSSTNVHTALEVKNTYTGAGDQASGGYTQALLVTGDINTAATIDKHVGLVQKTDYLSNNHVKFGIGIEPVIGALTAGGTIDLYAYFLCPNQQGTANIGTVTQRFCVLNQDIGGLWMNAGRTIDSDYNEFAPAPNPGLVTGFIYSAPITSYSGTGVVANKVYISFVDVPHRTNITKLYNDITLGGAGNGRVAMYKVGNGQLGAQVAACAEFSTLVAHTEACTVSATVNAGTYAIVSVYSGALHQIRYHATPARNAQIIGRSAIGNVIEEVYINFTYGALPGTFAGTPLVHSANGVEADLGYGI